MIDKYAKEECFFKTTAIGSDYIDPGLWANWRALFAKSTGHQSCRTKKRSKKTNLNE